VSNKELVYFCTKASKHIRVYISKLEPPVRKPPSGRILYGDSKEF